MKVAKLKISFIFCYLLEPNVNLAVFFINSESGKLGPYFSKKFIVCAKIISFRSPPTPKTKKKALMRSFTYYVPQFVTLPLAQAKNDDKKFSK
jgi:hypothetical protein